MEFFNDEGGDPLKPSLFELVAQEQLRDLLQPALKYVLAVFAQRYPRYLLRIVNRHEEFYAIVMFFVERHYLRKHGASFSENFYGLKRRRRPWIETEKANAAVGGIPVGEKLRSQELYRSLLFLIGIPYVRAKAQDYYEELGGSMDEDLQARGGHQQLRGQSFNDILGTGFKNVYPWLNAAFELWLAAWNIAYLFDVTSFYRPWLSWISVDLRRLGVADFRLASLSSHNNKRPSRERGIFAIVRRILLSSPQLVLDSLRLLLPTAIFFVKFLEWWYSPNSQARSLATPPLGPLVPPPQMLSPHPKGVLFNSSQYGQCPLCHRPINNTTALPSGYVFCYKCVYDHVEKHGKCPVTLLPVRLWQLRKVMT